MAGCGRRVLEIRHRILCSERAWKRDAFATNAVPEQTRWQMPEPQETAQPLQDPWRRQQSTGRIVQQASDDTLLDDFLKLLDDLRRPLSPLLYA